jgi:hypothetical protein
VKVVADSHALLYYLFTPDQLSDVALETLGTAEDTDGVVVSAASLGRSLVLVAQARQASAHARGLRVAPCDSA